MSVCLFVTWLHYAKLAEQIKVLFGGETCGDPRHIVLDVVLIVSRFDAAFIQNVFCCEWVILNYLTVYELLFLNQVLLTCYCS